MKRSNSAKSNTKKVKKEEKKLSEAVKPAEDVNSFIKFETGDSAFESLLGDDVTLSDFLENYWEKKPLIIRRSENAEWLKYIKKLFSLDLLKTIVKSKKPNYELDVNLCKLIDGKKEVFNKEGVVKLDHLEKSFANDKVTIQFHQPQRFSDELWKLLEKLECYFQCLVGSNIYITPSDSQGLASHYDDIEAFVIQLEGSKHWLLYEPEIELPNTYSKDLDANSLKTPSHDIVLHTGDILYFPRGVIHQANTPANEQNSYSTHVTISTYQNFNKMELVNLVIQSALEKSFLNNLELRKGLPIRFFRQGNFESIVQTTLQNIKLEPNSCAPKEILEDFMATRLPPYQAQHEKGFNASSLEIIQQNDKNLKFRLKYPEHNNVLLSTDENREEEDENEEEEEENSEEGGDDVEETPFAFFYSSTSNVREHHMMSKESVSPQCIKLKPEFYDIAKYLIENIKNSWTSISEIEKTLGKTFDINIFYYFLIPLAVENQIEIKSEDD